MSCAYKKTKHVGPGGINCPCCAPPESARPKWFRAERSRAKQATAKEIKYWTLPRLRLDAELN